jgi:uncharacterized protein (DUF433 family)
MRQAERGDVPRADLVERWKRDYAALGGAEDFLRIAGRSRRRVGRIDGMLPMDLQGCEDVERVADRLSGVPVLRGTRVQVDSIIMNYEAGLSAEEIADLFQLRAEQVQAVIEYAHLIL